MSLEVTITLVGLVVAGLAAVLGIWVERDPKKPPRYAYALSILILLATAVGMFQTYMDAKENEKMEGDMARMLAMLDKIAAEHGDAIPELNDMVKTEIAAQSRANPEMVNKVAQRVADQGRDPVAMLSRSLPASDVQDLQRRGRINIAGPAVAMKPGASPESAPSAAGPRLVLRMPGAGAASGEALAEAPAASASAEAAAPAESASAAPLTLRLPGGAASGSAPGIRLPGRGKPGGGEADKPAPASDKPKPGAPRVPRIGGGH